MLEKLVRATWAQSIQPALGSTLDLPSRNHIMQKLIHTLEYSRTIGADSFVGGAHYYVIAVMMACAPTVTARAIMEPVLSCDRTTTPRAKQIGHDQNDDLVKDSQIRIQALGCKQ